MRTFIAIELNNAIKQELAGLQDKFKTAGADVKWVKPENVHLTLKFLGNIDEEKAGKVKSILDNIASKYKKFQISLFKIGCFPRLEHPRVVWVGIDQGCADIEEIAKNLEEELEGIGFAKEKRPFSAHLTLGRVRSPKGRAELVQKIKALEVHSSASLDVAELVLFKSTLTPTASIYTPLHASKLG